ncbi:hypothetical protein Leryth_024870, partial [Lithospermum erythrorhizon]
PELSHHLCKFCYLQALFLEPLCSSSPSWWSKGFLAPFLCNSCLVGWWLCICWCSCWSWSRICFILGDLGALEVVWGLDLHFLSTTSETPNSNAVLFILASH